MERVVHQSDCFVNVVLNDFVAEVEFGERLRESDYAEQGTRGHVHVAVLVFAFALEFAFLNVLGDDVVVQLGWDHWLVGLSVSNECSHDVVINSLMISLVEVWGCEILMDLCNVLSQFCVLLFVDCVKQEEDQIETRKKSCRQIDVLMRLQSRVVSPIEWVGCGHNRCPGIERSRHSSLGN